jgi:nicotinic acid mononucleotide adenylyltransferase
VLVEPFPLFSTLEDLRGSDVPTLVVVPEPEREPRSVVLLSGSFDPVTVAHVVIADGAAADRNADLTLFVYSARTLPKDPGAPPPMLGEAERLESLRRLVATRARSAVGLCSHGLLAEQVEAAAKRFPQARLAVAMGSDKLLQILDPAWYDERDPVLALMLERASLLYALRSGDEAAVEDELRSPSNAAFLGRIQGLAVPRDVADVSSRLVRELLANGEDPRDLVPEAVLPVLPQRRSGGS